MLSNRIGDRTKMRLRSLLAHAGVEVAAFTGSFSSHRIQLLKKLGVVTVWDIGAHVGQYGQSLRDHGFAGAILSVEPEVDAFHRLSQVATTDPTWHCINVAVGEGNGVGILHVSANGQSSSLYPMLPLHAAAAPSSMYVGDETVAISSVDDLKNQFSPRPPFCLKVDVQGAEEVALRGAQSTLDETVMCEVELSLAPLYENGADWLDVVSALRERQFHLCDVDRVFFDRLSGDLLQVNGLFRLAP